MLPCPCVMPLIFLEGLERHDPHSSRPTGAKPDVDVVERTCGRRHAECCRHPAREPVEIVVRSERLWASRYTARVSRMQVDDVEVGGLGEGVAAEPPQSEHQELAPGTGAVGL